MLCLTSAPPIETSGLMTELYSVKHIDRWNSWTCDRVHSLERDTWKSRDVYHAVIPAETMGEGEGARSLQFKRNASENHDYKLAVSICRCSFFYLTVIKTTRFLYTSVLQHNKNFNKVVLMEEVKLLYFLCTMVVIIWAHTEQRNTST